MIIGISGRKGAGKNEVSTMIKFYSLTKHFPHEFVWTERQFAGIIKKMIAVFLNCDVSQLENQNFKESQIEWLQTNPRWLLQTLGTAWGRETIRDDIWVRALLSQYEDNDNWIITDVRFPNEVHAIKEKGGLLIRVNRGGDGSDYHPSEIALDNYTDWDYVIDNNGSLGELQARVEYMCKLLGL